MSKKVSDVIKQARYILNDEARPHRYTELELVSHVNNCVSEVKRIRPDYFEGAQDNDLPILVSTDLLPIDSLLFNPIVFYTAGMAELADDEHVNSGRAAGVLQGFYRSMNSPTGTI